MQAFNDAVQAIPSASALMTSRGAVAGASAQAANIIKAITEKLQEAQADPSIAMDSQVTVDLSGIEHSSSAVEAALWAFRAAGYGYSRTQDGSISTISISW